MRLDVHERARAIRPNALVYRHTNAWTSMRAHRRDSKMRNSRFGWRVLLASLLPASCAAQVCSECDDARACGSCSIDVSFVTEPLLQDDVDEINLFIGGFELSSARADALSSWQVTWSFAEGQGIFRGNVSDGILINPGGPNGQPARVVNQLNDDDDDDDDGRSFSFIGRLVDGYESSNVVARDVSVNGLSCASPRYAGNEAVRFVDIDCVRREYRFCCGSRLSPPPPPPPPPFLPPNPRVGAQASAVREVASNGAAWLKNASAVSALVVACVVASVFTIEIGRRVSASCLSARDVVLLDVDVEGLARRDAAPKRKTTTMLPGQCFRSKSDDLEGVVVRDDGDDDTARVRAGHGTHSTRRHARGDERASGRLFDASLASYAKAVDERRARVPETPDDDDRRLVEIHPSNIKLGESIGSGAYGAVYAGTWNKRTVAVKKLHSISKRSDVKTFLREVSVLSKAKHPNIVQLFGACLKSPHFCIVEELMDGGSLHARLHETKRALSDDETLRVALDVARALEYLHSKSIVHRDLKSHNVLLNARGAKVADFGIARAFEQTLLSSGANATKETTAGVAGTPAYMPPELFQGESSTVTTKCDVFSFAILLWEMLACEIPWHWCANHMQIIFAVAIQSQRLPLEREAFRRDDAATRTMIDEIIVPSWQTEPDARPDFSELHVVLKRLLSDRLEARDEDEDENEEVVVVVSTDDEG